MSRRRNPRLKKSHTETDYTAEQAKEMLRCAMNPSHFIKNFIYIKNPVKGKIKFDLYDYQYDMIDLYHRSDMSIVLSARQTGKTETISAYLLWFAMFHEDVTVLIASNKSDNAKEIIGKIQYAYEELPHWLKPGIDEDSWNKHECRFDNNSRIVSTTTSKDSGRGMAISLLYCDEFAFVKTNIQEEFWTSIQPTLSTGGRCIISSTPNGNSNKFAQLWRGAENGLNEFKHMHIPWDAPPGRDEDFKNKQIGLLGKRKWLQEYECEFLSEEHTLIDTFVINQLEKKMDKDYEDNQGEPPVALEVAGMQFYKKINRSLAYLVGVDVASGNGNDYSVITVVEFPTMEQVLEFRSNKLSEKFLYSRLKNLLLFLQQNSEEVYFSVENNGLGASVLALYEFDENPPTSAYLISDENTKRLGLAMSEATKRRAAMKFKNMVETGTYKFYSRQLLNEMKGYTRQGATFKAEIGATDDCIASNLIIVRIVEEMAEFNPYAYEKIYNTRGYDDKQEEWDSEFVENPRTLDDMPMPISIG
jgi:hypothetical protein